MNYLTMQFIIHLDARVFREFRHILHMTSGWAHSYGNPNCPYERMNRVFNLIYNQRRKYPCRQVGNEF